MARESNVTFRRIRGRIVPIKKKDHTKVLVGGAAVAGAIAFEASRRKKVFKSKGFSITRRDRIFSATTSLTARNQSLLARIASLSIGGSPEGATVGQAILRRGKRRLIVENIFGINPKANLSLFTQTVKEAKRGGFRTITGDLVNKDLVRVLDKRGVTFTSTSKQGIKRVSAATAKGEISRAIKGAARAAIRPLIKVKL